MVLPTRLIHIARTTDRSSIKARLVHGLNLDPRKTQYLTLSHAWGDADFLKCTCNNYEQLQVDIPLASLPANFRDAIFVTVELGFSYLWLDSLCIRQDDREDWHRESKMMGNVYRYSTCNISAAYANGNDGFLCKGQSVDPNPPWLDSPDKDGTSRVLVEAYPWYEISKAPLFERAWVLQEQTLAPRALHFGQSQIFWECKDIFGNELWPSGWSKFPPGDILPSMFSNGFYDVRERIYPFWQFSIQEPRTVLERNKLYTTWSLVVEEHSKRKLTFPSDRLPAIEGIASEFSKCFVGDRYVHGLWELDLHRGLLWYLPKFDLSETPREQPDWMDVPSWSWASIDAPVRMKQSGPFHSLSNIECRDECQHKSPLHVTGKLLKYNDIENIIVSPRGRCTLHWDAEEQDPAVEFRDDEWYPAALPGQTGPDSGRRAELVLKDAFVLPLVAFGVYGWDWYGILLLPCRDKGNGVYRRIGLVDIHFSGFSQVNTQKLQNIVQSQQTSISPEDYHEKGDEGNYTVIVI